MTSTGWSIRPAAIVLLVTVFGGSADLDAQDPFLEVTPSVANGFFPSRVLQLTTQDGTVLEASLEDALAGGLSIEVRPLDRLSVAFEVTHVFSTAGSVTGGPSVPLSIDVPTGFTYYGGAVRFHVVEMDGDVSPFVVGGVGTKEFDPGLTGSASPFAVSAGAGLRLRITGWPDVRTEIRDHISSFDPGLLLPGVEKETYTQHDLFWTVGAVLGVF